MINQFKKCGKAVVGMALPLLEVVCSGALNSTSCLGSMAKRSLVCHFLFGKCGCDLVCMTLPKQEVWQSGALDTTAYFGSMAKRCTVW